MDVAGALTLGALVGVAVGAVVSMLGFRVVLRRHGVAPRSGSPGPDSTTPPLAISTPRQAVMTQQSPRPPSGKPAATATPPVGTSGSAAHAADGLAMASLHVLRAGVVLVDADDHVVYANPSAIHLGLVDDVAGRLTVPHLLMRSLATGVRRSGQTRDVEVELSRAGREPLGVRVRVVALCGSHVAIEVEDMTEAHQVARVRRDFVANVSHELKTPVGALQLLSEALLDATDDIQDHEVAAIRRFTDRIRHESTRLGRLVSELLELSRLQGGEPLPPPELVAVDRIVNEVLDRSRTTASAKEIAVAVAGRRGLKLYGHERLLVTAVANLVDNAIVYSPEATTVTIAAHRAGDDVEISVTDEGIGIAEKDQGRIFERFYRADPARSRATGGTGLGLAIVKHIATNHGGGISMRSALGEGSTFTLRLPSGDPGGAPAPHRTGELEAATIPRRAQASTASGADGALDDRGPVSHEATGPETGQGPDGPAHTQCTGDPSNTEGPTRPTTTRTRQ